MSNKMVQACYKRLINLLLISISAVFVSNVAFAASSVEGIQLYQPSITLSPEHKQSLEDDISRYQNADNLWDVLRDEFSLPHYEDNPAVQRKIEWYMENQDFLLRSASRAAPYLYYILQQVKKRHLPAELVLLPIIESGYNPFSLSSVGAAGIWQLMPGTASDLGIKRDWSYDGRRDVIASTRGALNHLAYLQSFFEGNWLLAIAAYDTGEGNVLAAIKRNIRDGRDTDFWSLPVAQETKDYVPSLLALAVIISNPNKYPIYFPPVRNAPYLAQVEVGNQLNLRYAAWLAGISYQKLIQLNPGFNRAAIAIHAPYKLVLPIENVAQFTENLAKSPMNSPINWLHYRVKTGDTLLSISKKFGTTVVAIRQMNHLSKMAVRPGANLLLPNNGPAPTDTDATMDDSVLAQRAAQTGNVITMARRDNSDTNAINLYTNNIKYALQPGDTIYMVRVKDTMAKIAKHFHITVQALRSANQLHNKTKLAPGKQLLIPTHLAALPSPSHPKKIIRPASLQPGDTVYMVRHGDTIEKIAGKFHTTPAIIRLENLVDNDSLTEGMKLTIPTHLRG